MTSTELQAYEPPFAIKCEGEYSSQEIFNRVVAHIILQGRPATTPAGGCMYRAKRDEIILACAVGAMVPSSWPYLARWDKHGMTMEDIAKSGELPPSLAPHTRLLRLLQQAHDQAVTEDIPGNVFTAVFKYGARLIGNALGLDVHLTLMHADDLQDWKPVTEDGNL